MGIPEGRPRGTVCPATRTREHWRAIPCLRVTSVHTPRTAHRCARVQACTGASLRTRLCGARLAPLTCVDPGNIVCRHTREQHGNNCISTQAYRVFSARMFASEQKCCTNRLICHLYFPVGCGSVDLRLDQGLREQATREIGCDSLHQKTEL